MSREITPQTRVWLVGELDAWRTQGLVTDSQVKSLLALYPTDEEFGRERTSKALLTLMALAATLVGLGVFLLIGYNWDELPQLVKVALIFGAVAAFHGLGAYLRFVRGQRGLSDVAFFFGSLMYGGGIWLLAQMFNIPAKDASGFWWWALGVLPLALCADTIFLHVLYALLLGVWAGAEILWYNDLGMWLFFGRFSRIPNAAYSLLLLAAPGFWWSYARRSAKGVGLYVPLVAWWVFLQPFAWRFSENPCYFLVAMGAWLLLLSAAHRDGSPMAVPYRFYGVALVAGTLVPMSFKDFRMESSWGAVEEVVFIFVLAVLTLTAVALYRNRNRGDRPVVDELATLARRQWLPFGLIVAMTGLGLWTAVTDVTLPTTLAANALMVGLALWMMQVGLHSDDGRAFSCGVMYFLLWAVLRYIDLFGAFGGMIGAALMFFLCGLTLFGVAIYWRRRKEVHLA